MVYVDFTTYGNVLDTNSDYTITPNKITISGIRRDVNSYITKDYTADHFTQTLEHLYKYTYTGYAVDKYGVKIIHGIGNSSTGTLADLLTAGSGIVNDMQRSTTGLRFALEDLNLLNSDFYQNDNLPPITYYLKFKRDTTPKTTIYIYSDEARTILLDTIFITCVTTLFRYCYNGNSREDAVSHPTAEVSGEIENLDLQEVTPTTSDKNIPNYFNSKYITRH